MKTVGILGGLDFLGCDITLKFLSENYFVKVLDFPRNKNTPSLINTSIQAGEHLKIFSFDIYNTTQLSFFTKGCDYLIHCGRPFRLDVKMDEGSLYVPVITDSACLLKVLFKSPFLKKIIFLTSVAVLNTHQRPQLFSNSDKVNDKTFNLNKQRAKFHSDKIISKAVEDMSGSRLEVVHVSPVIVCNNMLTNNRETTLAGLHFLFQNKIVQDTVFQKLVSRNLLDTMIDAEALPAKVYSCCQ